MTNNTIPSVPRELLERAAYTLELAYEVDTPTVRDIRALLSAPSPAGVDGLGNTAKLLLPALRQYMHNDGSGLLAGYDLETTQAIIDGLRGEVARLQRAEKNDAIAYKSALERQDEIRTERDQQAQRIGELEGLLRSCLPALSDGGCAALANRIDAALSDMQPHAHSGS